MTMPSRAIEQENWIGRTIVRHPDIVFTTVGGEAVLMSAAKGKYYGLDDIGTDIWNRLETPIAVDALCASLSQAYDASAETIHRDVSALLDKLSGDGLIEVCR